MKKRLLAASLLVLALGVSACSSKQEETATTAATEATTGTEETTTEAETSEEETEEDIEEDYIMGYITAMDGDILTVRIDGLDEEHDYDISDADVTLEFPLSIGDMIEITFPAETTDDPVPAIAMEVLESETAKNTDPSVEAEILASDDDTITISTDDGDYTLVRSNAYVVGTISNGETATITYLGDLDDDAIALKIVMEDSYDTPEAEISAFKGTIVQIEDESMVLESAQGDFFTFVSSELDFSAHTEGEEVTVVYTGSISVKDIPAVEIQ
ncbi:MAG: hypothetical protein HFG64_14670 [Lachnospiraceae bacterium]|nr:hypothetical protein [Lachnospiraceae bacterium]